MSKTVDKKPADGGKEEQGNPAAPEEEKELEDAASDAAAADEQEVLEGLLEDAGGPEARAAELERENSELLENLVRLKADFENYRKRMLKEQTRILETAEADLVKKLLSVVDNLERALSSAPAGGEKGLREGVEMVLEQMLKVLEKEGLEVIDPQGEAFDPEYHEAMMVVETDECQEDTVIEVVQKGFRFNGRLLRPAMVKVSCRVKK